MMEMTLNEEIEYLQSGNWYDRVRTVLSTDEYLKLGWAIGDILEALELLRSLAPEPPHVDTLQMDLCKDCYLNAFNIHCGYRGQNPRWRH